MFEYIANRFLADLQNLYIVLMLVYLRSCCPSVGGYVVLVRATSWQGSGGRLRLNSCRRRSGMRKVRAGWRLTSVRVTVGVLNLLGRIVWLLVLRMSTVQCSGVVRYSGLRMSAALVVANRYRLSLLCYNVLDVVLLTFRAQIFPG